MKLDLSEKVAVVAACALSLVMALLCYAGYQSRSPSDRPWRAYAAGWTAFWLAVTVALVVGVLALIDRYRADKAKRASRGL